MFFRSDAPERYKTQITDFENAIVKVKEYCDQHQIRFYILLLPAREQSPNYLFDCCWEIQSGA